MLSFPMVIMLALISLLFLLILYLINLDMLSLLATVGILALINLSMVGTILFLLLFLGRVIVSFAIGQLIYRYLLRATDTGTLRRWLSMLALGGVIYALLTNIPVPWMGLTLELIAILAGIGAVAVYLRQITMPSSLFGPSVPVVQPAAAPRPTPTPVVLAPPEDEEVLLGMDNLPEGFTGFDD
jgi:hypothetical protein